MAATATLSTAKGAGLAAALGLLPVYRGQATGELERLDRSPGATLLMVRGAGMDDGPVTHLRRALG